MVGGGSSLVLNLLGKFRHLLGSGGGVCDVAEAGEGGAASVIAGEEKEGCMFRRSLGGGRVVDDGVLGGEGGLAIGEEGVVGGDFEGALRPCCRLVSSDGNEGEGRRTSGVQQPGSWTGESSELHCGRWNDCRVMSWGGR